MQEKELSNATVLSLKPETTYYNGTRTAAGACERFLYAASLLAEGEFLGCQIDVVDEGEYQVCVYSSKGVSVLKDDFRWIFSACAEIEDSAPKEHAKHEKKYMLRAATEEESKGSNNIRDWRFSEYGEDPDERPDLRPVVNALREFNASIILIVGREGTGEFYIELPDIMPIRLRTMFSMAFPKTVVNEMREGNTEGEFSLSTEFIGEGMSDLLAAIMYEKGLANELGEDLLSDCDMSKDEILPKGAAVTLEELDLSVRSYNSLTRAGIDTIEKLNALSDTELLHIRNIGRKQLAEIREKLSMYDIPVRLDEENYQEKLDKLVGLENVKEQVRKISAFAKMKKDIEGKKVPIALNMEFVGNPGTAKTTVARIIAGIFSEIGIISSKEMIEVGRADLIARYEGQTADKVKSVFKRAKGKLLFIDEAYSLLESVQGEYGDEAITTIVQEMENNRDDTIVIFAGYPEEMKAFFSRNPGLRSRVPFTIDFRDYSADEMVRIAELEAEIRGFSIEPGAMEKVKSVCEAAISNLDSGNGRFCRNLVERAVIEYAARVYGNDEELGVKNCILAAEDFSAPCIAREMKKKIPIGFHV